MRIDAKFGSDTGMALVDVFLETERERALEGADVWAELRPLFAAEGISLDAVVDCFLHKQDADGNWVSAGVL